MQSGPDFENALRNSLVSGTIFVDGETNVATLNSEAVQILGLPANEGLELPLEQLPAGMVSLAKDALLSGKPSATKQILVTIKGGTATVNVSAVPLTVSSGKGSVILVLNSLSPARQFQQQIRQLDRLASAGTLAAGMAHEIKNALVAGRTFLDLLLEKNTDAELVQIVRRETNRIDTIVTRTLRFTGTTTTALSALHLHEVLEHALRLVQPQLRSKFIVLDRSFRAQSDAVKGDEYELQQAFVNLLLNALEAMSEKGKLTLLTETLAEGSAESRRLRILVQDTGSGILPEHMEHLFEPFFTTKESGTGLGLAITRRIIQDHGGSISVESQPGQGTRFTILLPLLVEPSGMQLGGFATTMLGRNPT